MIHTKGRCLHSSCGNVFAAGVEVGWRAASVSLAAPEGPGRCQKVGPALPSRAGQQPAPLQEGPQPWEGLAWGSGTEGPGASGGDGTLWIERSARCTFLCAAWRVEVQKGGKGKGGFSLLLVLSLLVC